MFSRAEHMFKMNRMYKNNDFVYEAVATFEEATEIPISIESMRNGANIMLKIKGEFFYGEVKAIGKRTDFSFLNKVIEEGRKKNTIIIADYLTGKMTKSFKENKINYLDLAGNCFIEAENIFIYVEGRKNKTAGKSNPTLPFQEAGLKLLLFLISNPESLQYSYRELADKADISLGSVGNIMNGLEKDSFLLKTKNERLLKKQEELIERWVIAYKEVLKPRCFRKKMRLLNNVITLNSNNNLEFYWGGEPGGQLLTEYLSPLEYTLYSNEEMSVLSKDLRLAPDENGNMEVYEKFWTDAIKLKEKNTAPALVIYADLMNTGNSRNIETAKLIRENGF